MVLANLKSIREQRGMTQKQLADALLYHERTIIRWEGGEPTTANNAKRVAVTLRVKVKDLVS